MIRIAIDGPAGAGKSTIAKTLAKRLDFIYVDTGALYRTVGLFVRENKVEISDVASVIALLPKINIELKYIDGVQRMFLNGEDVTEKIREHDISKLASDVSAIPAVREFLLETQRELARKYNVLMDGRDIGTVVLPDAQVKIFLTASPEERARRRYEELKEKGNEIPYERILEDIKVRDFNDSNRKVAPLKPASDSILIDTTGNELNESIELLYNTIREKLNVL